MRADRGGAKGRSEALGPTLAGSLPFAVSMIVVASILFISVSAAAPVSRAPVCPGDGSRVALLIGNQTYQPPMQELANPHSDVAKLSELLCSNAFTVFKNDDLTLDGFDDAIDTFAAASKGAKTALIYYSGHGFAVGGRNWLVPTDAKLGCEDVASNAYSPRLNRKLVNLDEQVFSRLNSSADQIVILDACRTDPVKGCRGSLGLSLEKGLTRATPSAGRLIVYATQDGQVALDAVGDAASSPLMAAMTTKLAAEPHKDWVAAMLDVSDAVADMTHQRQRPNLDISVRPQGCLAPSCGATPAAEPTTRAPAPATPPALPSVGSACSDPETAYWRAAAFNTVDGYKQVLDTCPNHPRKEAMLIAIRKLVEESETKTKQQKQEALWQDALKLDKRSALRAIEHYVEDNPDGAHVPEARQRIAALLADPEFAHRNDPPPVAASPPMRGSSNRSFCVGGLKNHGPNNFLVLRNAPIRDPNGGWDPDIRMFNGERLTVFGESGDFYHVRTASGREGWSAREKIRPCDEATTAPDPEPSRPTRGNGCQVAGLSSVGPDNWLALRTAPSRTAYFPPNLNMYNGTSLNVIGRSGDWFRVRTMNGEVGWASARYITCR